MAYIDNLNASIAEHQRIIDAGLPEAAEAAQIIAGHQAEIARVQGSGGGGGGGAPSAQDAYYSWLQSSQQAAQAEAQRQQREAASSFLHGILNTYGMGALAGSVESLINEWGTNTEVIAEKLRQTDSYKTRFKGLLGLQTKGVTDVRNEAEYLQLETSYRRAFADAGLGSYLGQQGTQVEYDAIAKIVGDYSLSVNEVKERISDAQRVVGVDTPAEIRAMAQEYYGIQASDMVAYTLGLENSKERINQLANAAMVGGYGKRVGLDINRTAAEQVGNLAGGSDLNVENLSRQLADATEVRDATVRLANIDNIGLSDSEVVQSEMGNDVAAKKKTTDLKSRERARFSGSSGVGQTTLARGGGV